METNYPRGNRFTPIAGRSSTQVRRGTNEAIWKETTMTDFQQVAENYIRAWNETDPAARRTLIERTWSEDASFTDPLAVVQGRDAIDALIGNVQAQFLGFTFQLTGKVDGHNDRARFSWELFPAGAADSVAAGTDFVVVSGDGKLAAVTGFLDKMPGN
jgi:hypothetical protein